MKLENLGPWVFQIFFCSIPLFPLLLWLKWNIYYTLVLPCKCLQLVFFPHISSLLSDWLISSDLSSHSFCNLHSGVIFRLCFKPQVLYFPLLSCWKFSALHSLWPLFLEVPLHSSFKPWSTAASIWFALGGLRRLHFLLRIKRSCYPDSLRAKSF